MARLRLEKRTTGLVRFFYGDEIHFGSGYDVWCEADEFKTELDAACVLSVEDGGLTLAECALSPDPQRRGVRRTGDQQLSLRDMPLPEGRYGIRCTLGGDTLFFSEVVVHGTGAPRNSSGERWSVVEGSAEDGRLVVSDMTQVKLTLAAVDPHVLDVVAADGPFEAYVVVSGPGGAFPFQDVTVNGSAPTWTRKDSLALTSSRWTLHVMRVADGFVAQLFAGLPHGAERDPDGALVNSMEVNN